MLSSPYFLVAFLTSLVSASIPSVDKCPDGAGFTVPKAYGSGTAPQSFQIGQPLNVKWSQPWDEANIGFIGVNDDIFYFFDKVQGKGNQDSLWDVNVNGSAETDGKFYMYMEDASDNTNYCWSVIWNAEAPQDSGSTTTASPTTISTTLGSGPTTIVITPTITTSPTATADANVSPSPESSPTQVANADSTDNGGLSSGAKAGIGVGVALGVIAIAGAAGAFFFFRRRKYSAVATGPETGYNAGEMVMAGGAGAAAAAAAGAGGTAGAGVLDGKQHGHHEFYAGNGMQQQGFAKQPVQPDGPQEMPAAQTGNVPRHEMPGDSSMSPTSGPMGHGLYEMGDSRH